MAVPDFQTLMLPLLAYLADGTTRRTVPEVTDHLAAHFHLTQDDLDQRLPSGVQPAFYNRTHWAVTYMAKAGLITRPARGQIAITPRGGDVIASRPERVDLAYLRRYPEFEEFRTKSRTHEVTPTGLTPHREVGQDPEELLYGTYESLRQTVEADILDRLQSDTLSWEFFEQLVVDLLSRMGFGSNVEEAGRRVTKRSGDDGIDGVIDEDRLGLDAVYIQAKRYGSKTRSPGASKASERPRASSSPRRTSPARLTTTFGASRSGSS
jgi:restriction system protein